MNRNIKTALMLFAGGILFFIGVNFSLKTRNNIGQLSCTVSLRYESSFTGDQIENAFSYIQGSENTKKINASFWKQATANISTTSGKKVIQDVDAIAIYGNFNDCYSVDYLLGSSPGSRMEGGCVISDQLAWELWGSNNNIGKVLSLSNDSAFPVSCRVTGIFHDNSDIILFSAPKEYGFDNVELSNVADSNPIQDAYSFSVACGLGTPIHVIDGNSLSFCAEVLSLIPMFPLLLVLLLYLHTVVGFLPHFARYIFLFVCCSLLALCIPSIIGLFPDWIIPAQWGNGEAWSEVRKLILEQLSMWYSLSPCFRDVILKFLFLSLKVYTFFSLVGELLIYKGFESRIRQT